MGTSQKVLTYRVFEGKKEIGKKVLEDGTVREIYCNKMNNCIMTGYISPISGYINYKNNLYVHCENNKWYRLLPNNCSLKSQSIDNIISQFNGIPMLTL